MVVYDRGKWEKPGGGQGNERIPGDLSKAAPVLSVFGGWLHMVHIGDSSTNIWVSTLSGSR